MKKRNKIKWAVTLGFLFAMKIVIVDSGLLS